MASERIQTFLMLTFVWQRLSVASVYNKDVPLCWVASCTAVLRLATSSGMNVGWNSQGAEISYRYWRADQLSISGMQAKLRAVNGKSDLYAGRIWRAQYCSLGSSVSAPQRSVWADDY